MGTADEEFLPFRLPQEMSDEESSDDQTQDGNVELCLGRASIMVARSCLLQSPYCQTRLTLRWRTVCCLLDNSGGIPWRRSPHLTIVLIMLLIVCSVLIRSRVCLFEYPLIWT